VALALVVQLLGGVTSVVSAAPTSRSVERPAAVSLICLACGIMYPALRQSDSLPAVAAAMELADLLLNGGVGSGRQGGCSCGLADAAASSSARRPSPAVVRILAPLLSRLEHLQAYTSNEDAAAQRLLASKGSHALIVRHLAWHVAAARASAGPQRGGHGTASGAGSSSAASAAGAVPACADLVPFLAGWEGAPTLQAGDALSPLTMTMRTLTWQLEAGVGAPAACPRCTPAQMLLVLEGAARWSIQPAASSSPGGVNRAAAHAVNVVRNLSLLFSALVQAEPAWLSSAAYAVPAARVLAAWLQAAAQKLAENAPTSAAGLSLASSSESVSSGDMRGLAGAMVLALFHVLLTPGGVIEAHSQHSQVPVQQLLGSCELLLRTDSRDVRELSVPVGLGVLEVRRLPRGCTCCHAASSSHACLDPLAEQAVRACLSSASSPMQGIVTHRPSWLEDMWRCGALPGLVVSAVKAISAGARDLARMARLLDAMLPLPVFGHQLWDATSSERQQFVMFALARVSGAVAALAIGGTEGTPGPELAEAAMIVLWSAAQQLGGQPLLRQQLEVAAPALLARADAVAAAAVASQAQGIAAPDAPGLSAAREPLRLLVDLGRQLDPLALGLSLPGCHNPACTSLAGVSEAAMPLKRCMGCKVAR
jgi:hypothetical protein